MEVSICRESPVIRDLLLAGRINNPSLGKRNCSPLVLPYSKSDIELILSYRFGPTSVLVSLMFGDVNIDLPYIVHPRIASPGYAVFCSYRES